MERRKYLPVYISCAAALAIFIAFIFIPTGRIIPYSVLSLLLASIELSLQDFLSVGLFMIAHIVIVLAGLIKCTVVTINIVTGRKEAHVTARSSINTVAVMTLLIGVVSVLLGMMNEMIGGTGRTVAFAILPVYWIYFGVGLGALLASAVSAIIIRPSGIKPMAIVSRGVSVLLSAAAFVLCCVFVPDFSALGDVTLVAAFILRTLCLLLSWFLLSTCVRAFAATPLPPRTAGNGGDMTEYLRHGRDVFAGMTAFVFAVTYTVLTALFDWCDNFLWFAVYSAIFGVVYIVFAIGCGIAHIISTKDDSRRMARRVLGIGSAAFFVCLSLGGMIYGGLGYALSAVVPACMLLMTVTISLLVSSLYNGRYFVDAADEDPSATAPPVGGAPAPFTAADMPAAGVGYAAVPDYQAVNVYFPAYYALQRIDMTPFTPREMFTRPDFPTICENIRAFSVRYGTPVSARTARSAVAALAASRLVYVAGDPAAADSAVRALGAVLGGGFGTETILDGDRTDSLLGRYTEKGFVASGFIVSLYSALKNSKELRAVTVAGVAREESSFVLPQISSFSCDPIRRKSVLLCENDSADSLVLMERGRLDITGNVRFAVAAKEGGVVSASARFGAAAVQASPDASYTPAYEPVEMHISMTDWNSRITDALSSDKLYLTEAEWKRFDRLDDALAAIGLRSDNIRIRMLERYIAVYMACGGSADEATDSGICAVILPRVTLAERDTVRAAKLADVFDEAFGPDAMPQSREFLRRAGIS